MPRDPDHCAHEGLGKAVALVDDIFGWLDQKGIPPAGPLFFRYVTIGDMEKPFDLEVGVPVAEPIEGADRVVTGSVPAGTYATLVHHGHPDKLYDSCAALEEWAERKGVTFQTSVENDKTVWGGRFEFYLTNPAEQPDMSKWSTEVAYLVASLRVITLFQTTWQLRRSGRSPMPATPHSSSSAR